MKPGEIIRLEISITCFDKSLEIFCSSVTILFPLIPISASYGSFPSPSTITPFLKIMS